MNDNQYISVANNSNPVELKNIPVLNYTDFSFLIKMLLADNECHCVSYYAVPIGEKLKFFCCIANDRESLIHIFSFEANRNNLVLPSLSNELICLHNFEREIHENFGVCFEGHPWLKPVRFPFNRHDKQSVINNYPFYEMESEELHEVGVGPIHAGIIEPGHFRFICNGEKVLHLEIQLGYQHRGIEALFITKNKVLQRSILAESIAGDSVIAHSLAYTALVESLAGMAVPEIIQIERCIALEMERIAIHIGDTAALCTDIAYQLGQVTNEALRTGIINKMQYLCGNRFGKGLIRPGGNNYPVLQDFNYQMLETLEDTNKRYCEMAERIFSLPNVLSRFDGVGIITEKQARLLGTVGMAARMAGIPYDIRKSHPFQYFKKFPVEAITQQSGDVLARAMLRYLETRHSIQMIKDLIKKHQHTMPSKHKPVYDFKMQPNAFAVSLTEGWRGEICHSAITDDQGEIMHYKIKDPSFHNWMALALAVRGQEISDFPVCNKSFNLSYCGNDL